MSEPRPRLLDLFCGAGGAAKGYQRAGFYVVGVDIKPQPRYCGDEFIEADAMTYPLDGFDAIHASPPCQAYCALKTMANAREHPELIAPTRERLQAQSAPWVMENVFGAPLINPLKLCGSQFGLRATNGYGLQRHRYFEASFEWPLLMLPCAHEPKTVGVYGAKARDIAKEKRHYAQPKATRGEPVGVVLAKEVAHAAMGVDWMNMDELSEAIPPAYTEWIGRELLRVLAVGAGAGQAPPAEQA